MLAHTVGYEQRHSDDDGHPEEDRRARKQHTDIVPRITSNGASTSFPAIGVWRTTPSTAPQSGQPPGLPLWVIVVRVALAPLCGRNMTEHLLDMGTTTRPGRPVAARAAHLSTHTP